MRKWRIKTSFKGFKVNAQGSPFLAAPPISALLLLALAPVRAAVAAVATLVPPLLLLGSLLLLLTIRGSASGHVLENTMLGVFVVKNVRLKKLTLRKYMKKKKYLKVGNT